MGVFKDRSKLLPSYVPAVLLHREAEVSFLLSVLADGSGGAFIHGIEGVGKTAVARSVILRLGAGVRRVYVDGSVRDTPHLLALAVGDALGVNVPYSKFSIRATMSRLRDALRDFRARYVVVVDGVDSLARKRGGVEVLCGLAELGAEFGQLYFVAASRASYPRLARCFAGPAVQLKPYDATQLRDIVEARAREAFADGAIGAGALDRCVELASRERGNARLAVDLLRVAGDIAERDRVRVVGESHVERAWEEIRRWSALSTVSLLPLQSKAVLLALLKATGWGSRSATTGEVYKEYRSLARELGIEAVTLRRVSGVVAELERERVVDGRIINRGRYGRSRHVRLAVDPGELARVLAEDLDLGVLDAMG